MLQGVWGDFDMARLKGITLEQVKAGNYVMQPEGIGDKIERMVKPIALALGLGCLDELGRLKPESGCAKRRNALNKLMQ